MRQIVSDYLGNKITRRGSVNGMLALGLTARSAEAMLAPLEASEAAGVLAMRPLPAATSSRAPAASSPSPRPRPPASSTCSPIPALMKPASSTPSSIPPACS